MSKMIWLCGNCDHLWYLQSTYEWHCDLDTCIFEKKAVK